MTAYGFCRQNFRFLDGVTSDDHGMSYRKSQDTAVAQYTTVSRWYIEIVSGMLQNVKAIAEGNGSLLDDSIVQYGSDMKYGNCQIRAHRPIQLTGVGQGRMKTGRYLVYSNTHTAVQSALGVGQKMRHRIGNLQRQFNHRLVIML